ncbi:MAG: ANTAR domain-containing protein [Acidimicrobiales bacterium]
MHISQETLDRSIQRLSRIQTEQSASLEESLEQMIDSVTSMFGLTGAGLMLLDDDQLLHSVLATDALGWELEHAQERVGEGPCVETLVYCHVISTQSVLEDERWPQLSAELADSDIGAVLGVPIRLANVTVGALNVYVDGQHEWDASDQHALQTYGSIVEAHLATALFAEHHAELAGQLQQALDTRVPIERCVGLLMGRHGLDAVAAFNQLRSQARSERRKVHDVAEEILAGHG